MNIVYDRILKVLRKKVYPLFSRPKGLPELVYEADKTQSQQLIARLLSEDGPCMIARLGSVELLAVVNYLGVKNNPHSPWKYIKGETDEWWWNATSIRQLQSNAGFFPLTEESVCRFSQLMLDDVRQVDVLGSWLKEECYLGEQLKGAVKVKLSNLEPPYLDGDENVPSWAACLEGRRVLVVHPFADTIKRQYARRELLFKRSDILPEFELKTLKAVQSIGGGSQYASWFDALQWMKSQMDSTAYDVCLIGCGAYGLPLAAHAKRTGHKAVHLGGALQLMFGIKGRRWEERPQFQSLFNDHWVRPSKDETPSSAGKVEDGCYW